MSESKYVPETPAILYLKAHGVTFTEYTYDYVDKSGTTESSRQLGVNEYHTIKTLVMEGEHVKPLIVLMHGGYPVSTKNLARQTSRKSVQPYKPEMAQRHNGYLVGGTSPSGVCKVMPMYVKANVLELERTYINSGRRGSLVSLVPSVLMTVLNVQSVNCADPD